MEKTLEVGTIVTIKNREILGNNPGTLGVCYENYGTGSSFIFENGRYDGFSLNEQATMLDYVGEDDVTHFYKFKNVIKLSGDFRNGAFDFDKMKTKYNLD